MNEFTNRVFGCAIVKAVNANYNADFTHQPRTLPDGTVYATDKAFKYSIRHYLTHQHPNETIFFYKRLNDDMNPLTLDETFKKVFGDFPTKKVKKKKKGGEVEEDVLNKSGIAGKLLTCLDVRFFGATFAGETNISIHGPVQVNHGINRFPDNEIYSEQIMSPFRNPEAEGREQREASTLGQQSKLKEGHYVHHFSINPQNLSEMRRLAGDAPGLTTEDVEKLKEAMRSGISYYDSAAKAGTDNELLFWVRMKPDSKKVLPVFTEYISVGREDGAVVIDFGELPKVLNKVTDDIEQTEVYYIPEQTRVINLPENCKQFDLTTGSEIG